MISGLTRLSQLCLLVECLVVKCGYGVEEMLGLDFRREGILNWT
jgi:hypothetical protein